MARRRQYREQKRNKIGTKTKPNRSQKTDMWRWLDDNTKATQTHHKKRIQKDIKRTTKSIPFYEHSPPFCPRQCACARVCEELTVSPSAMHVCAYASTGTKICSPRGDDFIGKTANRCNLLYNASNFDCERF